jgi:hypothetical protein
MCTPVRPSTTRLQRPKSIRKTDGNNDDDDDDDDDRDEREDEDDD